MADRPPDDAHRIMARVREECRRLGQDCVGTGPMLLGLLGEEDGPAVRALELSLEEASVLGQDRITSAHLLLGLLRTPDGVAGRALAALGVRPDRARESLR